MTAQVALAQVEERLTALRARHEQIESRSASASSRTRTDSSGSRPSRSLRRQENQRTLLEASSCLAICYLHKEAAERQLAELAPRARPAQPGTAAAHRAGSGQPHELARPAGTGPHARAERQRPAPPPRHALRPLARGLSARPRRLSTRNPKRTRPPKTSNCKSGSSGTSSDSSSEVPPPEQEIEELRRKLSRLGSVNLDALAGTGRAGSAGRHVADRSTTT